MKPIFIISTAFIIAFLMLSPSLVSTLPINKDISCAMLDWEEIEKMPYPSEDRMTEDEVLSSDVWEKLKKFAKQLPSGKLKEGFYRALKIISYALSHYTVYNASMTNNDRTWHNFVDDDSNNDTNHEYIENTANQQYFTNDYSNGKYSSMDLSSQPSRVNEEKIIYSESNVLCSNDSKPNTEENCSTDRLRRPHKSELTENMSVSTQFLTVSTSENPIETEFPENIEVLGRNALNNDNAFDSNHISQELSSEKDITSISEKHDSIENNNQGNDKTNFNSIVNSLDLSNINRSNENPFTINNYETDGKSNLSSESYINISNQSTAREQDETSLEMTIANSKYNVTSEDPSTSSSQERFLRNDFTNKAPDERHLLKNKFVKSTDETNDTSNSSHSTNQFKKTVGIEKEDVEKSLEFVNERVFREDYNSDGDQTSVVSVFTENSTSKTEFGDIIEGHSSERNEKMFTSDDNEHNNYLYNSHSPSEISSETLTTANDSDPEKRYSTSEVISSNHSSEKHQSLDYITTAGYTETKLDEIIDGQEGDERDNKILHPSDEKELIIRNNNDLNITSVEASSEPFSATTVGDLEIKSLTSQDNSTMDPNLSSLTVYQSINLPVDMIKPNTIATVTSTVPAMLEKNEREPTINTIEENDQNNDNNQIRNDNNSEATTEGLSEHTDDINHNLYSSSTTEFNTNSTNGEIELLKEVEINNEESVIPDSHKFIYEEISQNGSKYGSEEVEDKIPLTTELTNEYTEKHPLNGETNNLQSIPEVISENEPKFSSVSNEDISKALLSNSEENSLLINEVNVSKNRTISDNNKSSITLQANNLTTESELVSDDKYSLDQVEVDATTESSTTPHYRTDNEKVIKSETGRNYGGYEIHNNETNVQDDDIHVTIASTDKVSESIPDSEEINNLKAVAVPPSVETNSEDKYEFSTEINNIQVTVASSNEKVESGNESEEDNENHEDSSNGRTIRPSIEAITDIDEIYTTNDFLNNETTTGSTAEQIIVTHTESNYNAKVNSDDLLGNNINTTPDSVEVLPTYSKLNSNFSDLSLVTEPTTALFHNEEELEENEYETQTSNSHEILSTIISNAYEIDGESNEIRVTSTLKTEYPPVTDNTPDSEIRNILNKQDNGKQESHEIKLSYTKDDIQLATMSTTDQKLLQSSINIEKNINQNVTSTDDDSEILTTERSDYTKAIAPDENMNDLITSGVLNEHKLVSQNNKEEITTINEGSTNNYENLSRSTTIPQEKEKEDYTIPYTTAPSKPNYDDAKGKSETSSINSKFEYLPPQFFDDIESINQTENHNNHSFNLHETDDNIEVDDILIEKNYVSTSTHAYSPADKQEVLDHTISGSTGNIFVGDHQRPTNSKLDSHENKILLSTPAIIQNFEKSTRKLDLEKSPEVVLALGKSSEHIPEFDQNIQWLSPTTFNEFVVTEPNESNSYDGFFPYLSPVSKHYSQNRPLPNPVPQDLKRSNCVKVPEIIYSGW